MLRTHALFHFVEINCRWRGLLIFAWKRWGNPESGSYTRSRSWWTFMLSPVTQGLEVQQPCSIDFLTSRILHVNSVVPVRWTHARFRKQKRPRSHSFFSSSEVRHVSLCLPARHLPRFAWRAVWQSVVVSCNLLTSTSGGHCCLWTPPTKTNLNSRADSAFLSSSSSEGLLNSLPWIQCLSAWDAWICIWDWILADVRDRKLAQGHKLASRGTGIQTRSVWA